MKQNTSNGSLLRPYSPKSSSTIFRNSNLEKFSLGQLKQQSINKLSLLKKNNVSEKYQNTKVTIEQVYQQRMIKNNNIGQRLKNHTRSRENSFDVGEIYDLDLEKKQKIIKNVIELSTKSKQEQSKDFYYSHINEIRSIKEFMYMIEKLKRKNIEKKMLERLQLKHKILKIKELEVWKKMQYYLERRIRLFLNNTETQENQNLRSFEAFQQTIDKDARLKQFKSEDIQKEFLRCKNSQSFHVENKADSPPQQLTKKKLSKSQDREIINMLTESDQDHHLQDNKQKGTSSLLTMKVADQLLSLLLVADSKNKRAQLGTHIQNRRQEILVQLSKPFGGKMNFTRHSFTWLIENTLTKSEKFLTHSSSQPNFNIRKVPLTKGMLKEEMFEIPEAPYPAMQVIKSIDDRLDVIDSIMSCRPKKSLGPIAQPKLLKNRRLVSAQYTVNDRIKENVVFQRQRNDIHQKYFTGTHKLDTAYAKNDSYVNFYI